MKLSVDYGSHGFNEEYSSASEMVKRLVDQVDESVTEIIVKKTVSGDDGLFCSTDAF